MIGYNEFDKYQLHLGRHIKKKNDELMDSLLYIRFLFNEIYEQDIDNETKKIVSESIQDCGKLINTINISDNIQVDIRKNLINNNCINECKKLKTFVDNEIIDNLFSNIEKSIFDLNKIIVEIFDLSTANKILFDIIKKGTSKGTIRMKISFETIIDIIIDNQVKYHNSYC